MNENYDKKVINILMISSFITILVMTLNGMNTSRMQSIGKLLVPIMFLCVLLLIVIWIQGMYSLAYFPWDFKLNKT